METNGRCRVTSEEYSNNLAVVNRGQKINKKHKMKYNSEYIQMQYFFNKKST